MAISYSIFISSVQKELAEERWAVKDFILRDPLLSRFFRDVFLFEDIPAQDRKSEDIYLAEVKEREIYIGIFGNKYGWKNTDGKSPTELEFNHATETHRERLIFVKGSDDSVREPEMAVLVRKAESHLTRRRFTDTPGITREVYASLVDFLERHGALRTTPFDDTPCAGATLGDIDATKIKTFLETAEAKGRLTIKGSKTPVAVLQNFNLLRDGKPTNAAILLFGKEPSRFFNNIQLHCFHFYGTEKRKPIASQQPFSGTLFEMIRDAVEFVLGKIDRRVGTRATGVRAPVSYEVPNEAISEAIVNAVAHRNYNSNGFVQVLVFSDRIEVWNPGELPPGLTPELLRLPHGAIPRNPLIAEPLFRVQYAEKAGTGTTDMISDCLEAGLPEPSFQQRGPHFVVTLWRDWLTDEVMAKLNLNERQRTAILHVKIRGYITNAEFQKLSGTPHRTAVRDLMGLVAMGLLEHQGVGRGSGYVLKSNRAINVPIVPGSTYFTAEKTTGKRLIKNSSPGKNKKGATKRKVSVKTIDKTIHKTINKKPSTTEEAIINLIASNPAMTQKDMAVSLDMSEIGIRYNTANLKAKGLLRRVGGKKSGRWEILK